MLEDEARGAGAAEEEADGFAAVVAVVEGARVDVHADEFVGLRQSEAAAEAQGVGDGLLAVLEAFADGGLEEA